MPDCGIAVFCENGKNGVFKNVVFELLTAGRKIADELGESLTAVCLSESKCNYDELAEFGAEKVIVAKVTRKGLFNIESDTCIASEIIRKTKPSIVFFPATDYGRILAPKVAANLKCGITADCTDFDINKNGKLVQIRPALGGNILAHIISPEKMPQMATVRPSVFKKEKNIKQIKDIQFFDIEIPYERCSVSETSRTSMEINECEKIEDAKIVISVGKGIKSKEILKKIEQFALKIGGVVACSRKMVESGWMNHSRQVGQSGKTITPDIYIAIGISGAVQHLAGMKTASKIIAVNHDREADIFSVAHIGFVMDAEDWVDKALSFLRAD